MTDVVDRLNSDPATEYALYFPDTDSYAIDPDGREKTYWSFGSAHSTGENWHTRPRFEVHSRLNYAVTPWRKVEQ